MDPLREVKHLAGPTRAYRPHLHAELSLAYVWAGSTLARIDGLDVPISGECLVVIPPGVAHACNPRPGSGWSYTLALLDAAACPPALLADSHRILPASAGLRRAFLACREPGRDPGALALPLLEAVEEAAAQGPGQARGPWGPEASRALRRVRDHLLAHTGAPLALDELCGIAGLSKYHLVRAFRRAYGLTPHAYHLSLRVNAAKELLRLGREVARVAQDTGFCDQGHFTRVFARCVGVTPAAYRKATAIPSKPPAPRRT